MRVLPAGFENRLHYVLLVFALSVFSTKLAGQKILPDTFYIPFRYDSIIEIRHICISRVTDKRDDAPNFVRYETRRKYLLIPVDQEVYTRRPVAEEIVKGISCDPDGRQYLLELEKFSVEKKKGRFAHSLYLQADIPVYEYDDDSTVYRGTFFYDYQYFPLSKKETLEESTINLLSAWHTEFKLGLLSLELNRRIFLIRHCEISLPIPRFVHYM